MARGAVSDAGERSADGRSDVGADHGDIQKTSSGALWDVYGDPEKEIWREEKEFRFRLIR